MEKCLLGKSEVFLPEVFLEKSVIFHDVISNNTWKTVLTDREREHLMNFLPNFPENDEKEKLQTVRRLLAGDNFKFGNPLKQIQKRLRDGYFSPDISKYLAMCRRAKHREYKVRQQHYCTELLKYMLIDRQRVLSEVRYFAPDQLPPYVPQTVDRSDDLAMENKSLLSFHRAMKDVRGECGIEETSSDEEAIIQLKIATKPPPPKQTSGSTVVSTLAPKPDDDDLTDGGIAGQASSTPIPNNSKRARAAREAVNGEIFQMLRHHVQCQASSTPIPNNSKRARAAREAVNGEILQMLLHNSQCQASSTPIPNNSKRARAAREAVNGEILQMLRHHVQCKLLDSDAPYLNTDDITMDDILHRFQFQPLKKTLTTEATAVLSKRRIPSRELISERRLKKAKLMAAMKGDGDIKIDPDRADPYKTDPDKTDPDKTDPDKTDPDKTDPDEVEEPDTMEEEDLDVETGMDTSEKDDIPELPLEPVRDDLLIKPMAGFDIVQLKADDVTAVPDFANTPNYFSLLRQVFMCFDNISAPLSRVEEKVKEWKDSPIGAFCPWSREHPWVENVQSALKYLSGDSLGADDMVFLPLVEYRERAQQWKWIGYGHDNDTRLEVLCEAWLRNLKLARVEITEVTEVRTDYVVRPSTWEEKQEFREQEIIRFNTPQRAFTYTLHGYRSVVGPVKGVYNNTATNKAREHILLISERPPYVTILTLVRDAAARLPNGEGTRGDICELLRDSAFVAAGTTDIQLNTVVSGALDRLHYEKDPCVKYDVNRKLWIYLHRSRSEHEFERLHHAQGAAAKARKSLQKPRIPKAYSPTNMYPIYGEYYAPSVPKSTESPKGSHEMPCLGTPPGPPIPAKMDHPELDKLKKPEPVLITTTPISTTSTPPLEPQPNPLASITRLITQNPDLVSAPCATSSSTPNITGVKTPQGTTVRQALNLLQPARSSVTESTTAIFHSASQSAILTSLSSPPPVSNPQRTGSLVRSSPSSQPPYFTRRYIPPLTSLSSPPPVSNPQSVSITSSMTSNPLKLSFAPGLSSTPKVPTTTLASDTTLSQTKKMRIHRALQHQLGRETAILIPSSSGVSAKPISSSGVSVKPINPTTRTTIVQSGVMTQSRCGAGKGVAVSQPSILSHRIMATTQATSNRGTGTQVTTQSGASISVSQSSVIAQLIQHQQKQAAQVMAGNVGSPITLQGSTMTQSATNKPITLTTAINKGLLQFNLPRTTTTSATVNLKPAQRRTTHTIQVPSTGKPQTLKGLPTGQTIQLMTTKSATSTQPSIVMAQLPQSLRQGLQSGTKVDPTSNLRTQFIMKAPMTLDFTHATTTAPKQNIQLLKTVGTNQQSSIKPGQGTTFLLSQPALSQPGLSQPGLSQPGLPQPGLPQSGLRQHTTVTTPTVQQKVVRGGVRSSTPQTMFARIIMPPAGIRLAAGMTTQQNPGLSFIQSVPTHSPTGSGVVMTTTISTTTTASSTEIKTEKP